MTTKTSILAPGGTAADTSAAPILVERGDVVGIGPYVASGLLPENFRATINIITPGAAVPYAAGGEVVDLNNKNTYVVIQGPCEFYVSRPAGPSFGVYKVT